MWLTSMIQAPGKATCTKNCHATPKNVNNYQKISNKKSTDKCGANVLNKADFLSIYKCQLLSAVAFVTSTVLLAMKIIFFPSL